MSLLDLSLQANLLKCYQRQNSKLRIMQESSFYQALQVSLVKAPFSLRQFCVRKYVKIMSTPTIFETGDTC